MCGPKYTQIKCLPCRKVNKFTSTSGILSEPKINIERSDCQIHKSKHEKQQESLLIALLGN